MEKQTYSKQTCLNAQQFQLRRSERGFAKFSAFKLYRFHSMGRVSRFPPTGQITDSPPRGYFLLDPAPTAPYSVFSFPDQPHLLVIHRVRHLIHLFFWSTSFTPWSSPFSLDQDSSDYFLSDPAQSITDPSLLFLTQSFSFFSNPLLPWSNHFSDTAPTFADPAPYVDLVPCLTDPAFSSSWFNPHSSWSCLFSPDPSLNSPDTAHSLSGLTHLPMIQHTLSGHNFSSDSITSPPDPAFFFNLIKLIRVTDFTQTLIYLIYTTDPASP